MAGTRLTWDTDFRTNARSKVSLSTSLPCIGPESGGGGGGGGAFPAHGITNSSLTTTETL